MRSKVPVAVGTVGSTSASPLNDAMRSSETNATLTCAFSPGFVERLVASAETSTSVERKVEPSSAIAIVPLAIAALATVTVQGLSGAAAGAGFAGASARSLAPATGSKIGRASSSVPSGRRFRSTAGASTVADAMRASRPNTSMRSSASATRSAATSVDPSRRLTARASTRASPRNSSRRSPGLPSTNATLRRVVSVPPASSTSGFDGR